MKDDVKKYNKVVAYIRKSSEDNKGGKEHKQLNSIRYQRNFVKEAIKNHDLELVCPVFEDDKTGYEAFVRDDFNKMLKYLEEHEGEVDGIVCTEISRLARNFGDGGLLLWYMQSGVIKRIYTATKTFTDSSSDQLMVAIEFAMSKKSSDETGYRTREGMKTKARIMGHPARPAILGYMTRGPVGRKKWIIDPETGPLVKQVFEQFASSMYTFNEITDYAYSIGLRSRSKKSTTGKIAKNTWCNRLRDIQYTSIFYSDGEKVVGKYEDLVTSGLFYQVQEVINERKHPQRARLDYAYSGIVKCEFCGEMLSGTHKKGITYYRCGKRKLPCKGVKRAYVPEKKLEDELMKAFEFLEIDQKTWKVAREYVAELNQPERINIKRQVMGLTGQIRTEKRLQNKLGRKFAEDDLTKSEYDRLKEDSYQKEASLRKTVVKCEDVAHELNELMYGFLDNIKHVTKRLRMALPENKREMVSIFCENLIWKDGKLLWDWKKPYFILAKRPKKSNVLPNPCTNIKDINIKEILESFQNVAYIGVLRQRWEEIKKITKQPSLALSTV